MSEDAHAWLPIPRHYSAEDVGSIFHIPYLERGQQAERFAMIHDIHPAASDVISTCLLLVDPQNTFCTPGFELFVNGAVEDSQRLCEFIYHNLREISAIVL